MSTDLAVVFRELRNRMLRSAASMIVAEDEPSNLVTRAPWTEPGKKENAWFGSVQLKKNYVSYHLMPIYCFPALQSKVTVELRRRMQGKSCFNFKAIDECVFDDLEKLTAECVQAFSGPKGSE